MSAAFAATRVVHFDDQPYWVEFVARGLTESGLDVVGSATTEAAMQQLVSSTDFDVAVLDVLVGPDDDLTGLAVALWLRRYLPHAGVLMLTTYNSPFPAFRLMQQEPGVGIGYLLKTRIQRTSEIVAAVAELRVGHNVLDSEIRKELVSLEGGAHPANLLDDGELEILGLVVEGLTNKQIADKLHFSEGWVETRISAIFRKLGLSENDAKQRPNQRVKAVMIWVESLERFRDAKHVKAVDWPGPHPDERDVGAL